jgi:hypothetical protein
VARSCARLRCTDARSQVTDGGTVVSPRHPSCPPSACEGPVIAVWCEPLRAFEIEGFLGLEDGKD